MNNGFRDSLDWSKYKTTTVKRGDMSMIAATIIKSGEVMTAPTKQRFVWPRDLDINSGKMLTRRVWGQSK